MYASLLAGHYHACTSLGVRTVGLKVWIKCLFHATSIANSVIRLQTKLRLKVKANVKQYCRVVRSFTL